jgi:hypothetical protein
MRRVILGILFVLAVAGCAVAVRVWAAGPQKGGQAGIQIRSRYLAVHLRSSSEYGATLEKVQVRRIGDRVFLVGRGIDDGTPDNWYKGKTIWVAVDDIGLMTEFNDLGASSKVRPSRHREGSP